MFVASLDRPAFIEDSQGSRFAGGAGQVIWILLVRKRREAMEIGLRRRRDAQAAVPFFRRDKNIREVDKRMLAIISEMLRPVEAHPAFDGDVLGRAKGDAAIGAVMMEVYQAVTGGQYRLAAMGIRALLEQVMIQKVGDLKTFDMMEPWEDNHWKASYFCEPSWNSQN